MSQDNLLTKEQAAGALGISVRTLQRKVSKGEISVSYVRGKKGDEAYFSPDEIERIKEREQQAAFILKGATDATPLAQHGTGLMLPDKITAGDFLDSTRLTIAESVKTAFENIAAANHKQDVAIADKLTLSLDESAKLSGLSKNYLREAIHSKKLKAKIIGKGWRVKRADLETFISKL